MKIAFGDDFIYAYASSDPEASGGAERQQWLLGRALAASGWSVVVGVREKLEVGERKIIDGVEFVGIGQSHALLAWRRLLLAERPQWWYRRSADHLLGPAVEIAKLASVKTIFSAAFDSDVRPRRALSRRRQWWPLYAWGLERADRIFVQHEGQLSMIAPRWRGKTFIVPSLAPVTASFKNHHERSAYVAWAAMLRQPKRPDLLIDIARKAPDLSFVVCGEPTKHRSAPGYGERIVEVLRSLPNVEYRGRVAPDEAQRIIAEASAFLLTSEEEGFPNAFLQAWSSSTPVVSLAVDPGGVLKREGVGLITATPENTVVTLRNLIKSSRQREELARRAEDYVSKAHSSAAVTAAVQTALCSHVIKPANFHSPLIGKDDSWLHNK